MPLGFVDPEVFLQYKGVFIYHVYRHDNIDDNPRKYIYGNSSTCSDEGDDVFDVRDLPVPEGGEPRDHVAIIRAAIDAEIPEVIGEQIVLPEDPPPREAFAVVGFYGIESDRAGTCFVDVVAGPDGDTVLSVAKNRRNADDVAYYAAFTKADLKAIIENMGELSLLQ